MSATIGTQTKTLLWPDGRLDVTEEIRRALGIEGGWQCSIEIVDGAIVVRPLGTIPDEDLWAYEPETHARLLEAGRQPIGSGFHASPQDLKDLVEGRVGLDELLARLQR